MIQITNGIFKFPRDNIAAIKIASWPLQANLFDGDVAAGPVPVFFAEDPDEAKEAMSSDPSKAHYDIMRINKNYFIPECIGAKEAQALLKKPRYDNIHIYT
jgi:hypothetical protein